MLMETRYEHIMLNEDHVPSIAGTTTKVVELVVEQQAYGWSPEELHFQHPYLDFSHLWGEGVGYARCHPSLKEVIEMRTLPALMIGALAPFAPLFSVRVFEHVGVLVAGAILAPGKRTVASALRAMGLQKESNFSGYHRVLSRARWSATDASRILLRLLVEAFVPDGPLVVGVDETLERRRGKKITAKGVYRDPVRSSQSQLVKATGLRWVCVTLLVEVPWARRVWALPFLSALAPSQRYSHEQGTRHKPITELAGQLLLLIRRWCPAREIIAVGDGGYASLKLLDRCRTLKEPITFIARLRLDAGLYEPAPLELRRFGGHH